MCKFIHYFLALIMTLFMCSAIASDQHREVIRALSAKAPHLNKVVLKKALTAFYNAREAGITDSPLFTIVDYTKPSSVPRLWVFNVDRKKLLHEELVAHGKGSGELYARKFSNRHGSLQSSLGLFLTEASYYGQNGYSLRLEGLEKDINDRARDRNIVVHGADYATPDSVRRNAGRLGLSHGCFVVSPAVNRTLIDTIKDGSLVFVYYPERTWLAESVFLQSTPS